MPRVSEAHLAARRQQILDAARICFARNGFHATSMQDVIAEAGLSVGAFYRYFKSKEELVAAIAEQIVGAIGKQLEAIVSAEPPIPLLEALRRAIDTLEPQLAPGGAFRFAVQVWAESFRNPFFADLVLRIYGQVRGQFVLLARHAVETGELPPGTDVEAAGSALFSLVPGYGLQRVLIGEPTSETYLTGIRNLLDAKVTG
jgi:AcrR family transcriptional regulator